MQNRAYKIAISYFTLFALFLLYTIVALFNEKIGFTLESLTLYYGKKSFEGMLEIAAPHFMAMGLFVMVLTHFFLFTKLKKHYKLLKYYYLVTFVVIVSIFLKLYLFKLVTLLLFICMTFVLLVTLFFQTITTQRSTT